MCAPSNYTLINNTWKYTGMHIFFLHFSSFFELFFKSTLPLVWVDSFIFELCPINISEGQYNELPTK